MSVLEFFCDQSPDSSCSSYILTQIWLMLFFRTSRLEMKSYKTCKSLKEQKTVSLFLCISLWIFAFFFRFFISLCFSNILASSIFLGVMCVPEFFGDQWIEYNIGHVQISGFRRKQLILLNVVDLILLFLRRFLICFIFFFYLYPYLFFLKLWFIFFCLTVFIQDFWRPKNGHSFSLHISLDFCFLTILHPTMFL